MLGATKRIRVFGDGRAFVIEKFFGVRAQEFFEMTQHTAPLNLKKIFSSKIHFLNVNVHL
jgi:hypothetical protein